MELQDLSTQPLARFEQINLAYLTWINRAPTISSTGVEQDKCERGRAATVRMNWGMISTSHMAIPCIQRSEYHSSVAPILEMRGPAMVYTGTYS